MLFKRDFTMFCFKFLNVFFHKTLKFTVADWTL